MLDFSLTTEQKDLQRVLQCGIFLWGASLFLLDNIYINQWICLADKWGAVSSSPCDEIEFKTPCGCREQMITISSKARKMLKKQGLEGDAFVRILVKTGGCAGMTYEAEIAELMWPGENIAYQDDEVRIISDRESMPYLEGLEIDYSDDLISAGYRFRNDSNESSCGCGASFTLAGFPTYEQGGTSCDC